MLKHPTSLTDGCSAVLRLLAPRVPDAFFVSGAGCFGVGVWQFDPRAIWFYVGGCCVWLAFGLAASQRRGDAQ